MRGITFILMVALASTVTGRDPKHHVLHDGLTFERAIDVTRFSGKEQYRVELQLLANLHPFADTSSLEQALTCHHAKSYDILTMHTPAGLRSVFFFLGPEPDCPFDKDDSKEK